MSNIRDGDLYQVRTVEDARGKSLGVLLDAEGVIAISSRDADEPISLDRHGALTLAVALITAADLSAQASVGKSK
jgi:hypothetical protein